MQMFTRAKYQHGCIVREARKNGPDVWVLRWRDSQPDGKVVRRKQIIGTVKEYSESSAWKACERTRLTINRETATPRTVAELAAHYTEKEMSEDSNKSFSTRRAYRSYFDNYIVPTWGEHPIAAVKTVAVEEWLHSLHLAPGTKAKLRNIMSALFTHAMRYEWSDRNPIRLVRQSAKRQSIPDVLTVEEIRAMLAELSGPYRVMAFLAVVTGLRVSELLALKWGDIKFSAGQIQLNRAIVCKHIGKLKTETSGKPIAMDESLAAVLLDWRAHCPYNRDEDFVFASEQKRASNRCGPALQWRNISAPLRSGLKSSSTFAGMYSGTRLQRY